MLKGRRLAIVLPVSLALFMAGVSPASAIPAALEQGAPLIAGGTLNPSSTASPLQSYTSSVAGIAGTKAVAMGINPVRGSRSEGAKEGDEELATYTDEDGQWEIQYPGDLWHAERLNDSVVIFISEDRTTFVAVDTYIETASHYGNTGENLRNRARDTISLIYGRPIEQTEVISAAADGWQTGVTFVTDRGSEGEAVYRQPTEVQPYFRVYGFLYGYKAKDADIMLPLALAARASFTELY